jgi:hypothetical protein
VALIRPTAPNAEHGTNDALMSALGQKPTSRPEIAMSALPPKADIDWYSLNVRFVPKTDILRCGKEWMRSISDW